MASWVTTTAPTPPRHAATIISITAFPLTESSAPEGSSASSNCRSPTNARGDSPPADVPRRRADRDNGDLDRPDQAFEGRHGEPRARLPCGRRARVAAPRSPAPSGPLRG